MEETLKQLQKCEIDDIPSLLQQALDLSYDLMYTSPEEIINYREVMTQAIKSFANEKCRLYRDYGAGDEGIIDKDYLESKREYWDTNTTNTIELATGGTTRRGFPYNYWKEVFYKIENRFHYGYILEEFYIPRPPRVLCTVMGATGIGPKIEFNGYKIRTEITDTDNSINNHGCSSSEVHYFARNDIDKLPKELLGEFLVDYMIRRDIDIFLADGLFIDSVYDYVVEHSPEKFVNLISNTAAPVKQEKLIWLKDNGYIDNWCDHMRCWDGGTTFFTCINGTTHLMDNLNYTYEVDSKMICTDFFSLAAPFIDYHNGDFCSIDNEYRKCECGRWFRPFRLSRARPFFIKDRNGELVSSYEIIDKIR